MQNSIETKLINKKELQDKSANIEITNDNQESEESCNLANAKFFIKNKNSEKGESTKLNILLNQSLNNNR